MNLIELQRKIELTIECVRERGADPEEIPVSLQLGGGDLIAWGGKRMEIIEDDNSFASGCVIRADMEGRG